jgi:gliding motility-associated-like protein
MCVYLQFLHRLILALGCLLSSGASVVQAQQIPSFLWAKSSGGPSNQQGRCIEIDDSGNIYTTGIFSSISSFEASTLTSRGGADVYLAKYDSQGRVLWVRQIGGVGEEVVWDLFVDASGNAYITGDFTPPPNVITQIPTITIGTVTLTGGTMRGSEMFLAKYDSQGNVLWARQTFTSNLTSTSVGKSLVVSNDGNVYVTGSMYGAVRFDNIEFNLYTGSAIFNNGSFIAKYNAQGIVQWVKNNLGSMSSPTNHLAISSAGELYLSTEYTASLTLGSTTLPPSATNDSDLYLAKFDAQGNPIWVKPFIGIGRESCNGLTLDPTDNIVLAVSFRNATSHANQTFTVTGPLTTSNSDVLVLKYNPAGDLLWNRQLGGPFTLGLGSYSDSDTISGLATDSQGNIYSAATLIGMPTLTTSDGTGSFNHHFICYSPAGAIRWTRPAAYSYCADIAVTPCGEILSTGYIQYDEPFDQIILKSLGGLDTYIAKLGASTLISPMANCSSIPTNGDPPVPSMPTAVGKLLIPTIITPNGDNQNETFRLPGLPTGPWQLSVYNRWGTRVYHTADYRQDWNASGLPDGVYYYLLQNPNQFARKGWVEVIH